MNPQDMFSCGAVMALAVSGVATVADATPINPPSGVTVGQVEPHDGYIMLADKTDSYIRSSKVSAEMVRTVHHHHHHHHPQSRSHHSKGAG